MKAPESGRLLTTRLPVLIRLADILGLDDLAALTGSTSVPTASVRKIGHEMIPEVLTAMLDRVETSAAPPSVRALAARVEDTWRLWRSSSAMQSVVAPLLGDLVRDLRTACQVLEGADRRGALVEMARVYHLVQVFAAYSPTGELVWLAADRALRAAEDADDVAAIGVATWYFGHIWRATGQPERAEAEMMGAAALMDHGDPDQRSSWGQLQLGIALAAAPLGRSGDAWRHWDAASRTVDTVDPDTVDPSTQVGLSRASVDAYAVSIEVDLFQTREAIRRAERLDLTGLRSRGRRATTWLSVARAYGLRGDRDAAVHMLGRARRESTEITRRHPTTLALLDDYVRRPEALGAEARDLAVELGIGGQVRWWRSRAGTHSPCRNSLNLAT